MEIRIFDDLDNPNDNYAIYLRDGRYELSIGKQNKVYIFESFVECIEYIKRNISETIANILNKKENQLLGGVGIDVSDAELHGKKLFKEKIKKIIELLPEDASKLFSKYSFFYGFRDLEYSPDVDLSSKSYKVYCWYIEDGHKICNIGYTNEEIEFICKKKFEYKILKAKYDLKCEIIVDSLPMYAAYLYSKCLVFKYEDAGEYILENTAYSYREFNNTPKRGIYKDKFAKRYFSEYFDKNIVFDLPSIEMLDNISFHDEGVLIIDNWVYAHGGKVQKKPGKNTHCLVVKKAISYTEFIYYKELGINICSSNSILELIDGADDNVTVGNRIHTVILPKYNISYRDTLRETIARYKAQYKLYYDYLKLKLEYDDDKKKRHLIHKLKMVENPTVSFNVDSYPKTERDIFFDIGILIEGRFGNVKNTKKRLAKNYHKLGLFNEEIEILNGVSELEEMLAIALRCRDAELRG